MRYFVGFVLVLAASPLSVSAQPGDEATSEPSVEKPSAGSAPEEPALQLKLDDAGAEVAPSPRHAELEEVYVRHAKRRIRRAGLGLGFSLAAFVGGLAMVGAAISSRTPIICFVGCETPAWVVPVGATGGVLTAGGLAGTIVSGLNLRHSRQLQRRFAPAEPSP